MNKKLFTILIIGFINLICSGQDFDKKKLDNYFNTLEENNKFMGSVAILKKDKIIYSKSVGFSDIENNIKANKNSKYRIGSITKTFTAVLTIKAVEKNKLNLSQTIDKYFPKIKNSDKITIQHLLYHRSGIQNLTDNLDYRTWNTQPKTKEEMLEIIIKGGSVFEPDNKSKYSNSNYILLTFILEEVFHDSYSHLLKKYITEPIVLKNTYLGEIINSNNNECKSYKFDKTWILQPETDMSIPLGAGAIVSTPSDLVKFSNALFSGNIILKENLEQMKILKDNYGMGLFKFPFQNKIAYGHLGGIDGFSSAFSHFSNENISYAIISNGMNFNHNDISIAILSAIYNKPYKIYKPFSLNLKDLDKYIGNYSSPQIPLKITIIKKGKELIAQATGQSPFKLEAINKHKFKFDEAGIIMKFNPSENKMILQQTGGEFTFSKEE